MMNKKEEGRQEELLGFMELFKVLNSIMMDTKAKELQLEAIKMEYNELETKQIKALQNHDIELAESLDEDIDRLKKRYTLISKAGMNNTVIDTLDDQLNVCKDRVINNDLKSIQQEYDDQLIEIEKSKTEYLKQLQMLSDIRNKRDKLNGDFKTAIDRVKTVKPDSKLKASTHLNLPSLKEKQLLPNAYNAESLAITEVEQKAIYPINM